MIRVDVTGPLLNVLNGYTLCFESAAMENLLVAAPIGILTVYRPGNNSQLIASNLEIYVNDFSDFTEDCFEIRRGLLCTNSERTICELIKFERDDGFIYEALENYSGSSDILRKYARKYGVSDELEHYITTV